MTTTPIMTLHCESSLTASDMPALAPTVRLAAPISLAGPIATVDMVAALEDLAGAWNSLAGDVPFRSYEWLATWWRHYGGGSRRLFTVALRDGDGRLVGVAPWHVDRLPGGGRVVRFLGSGAVCSDYLSLLCAQERAAEVAERLADWLCGPAAGAWDVLDFSGVAADDPAVRTLTERLRAAGLAVYVSAEVQCWRTQLAPAWDEFLQGLSTSRRHRIRTLLRRSLDEGQAVLHTVRTGEQLARVFPLLVDLHQQRRRSLGQVGCFADPRFAAFQQQVCREFLAAGRLRLLWLELAGQPIAAEYGLTGGDTVYYYLGGFDPAAAAAQPGWLALGASLRQAVAEGYRAFDFLRGDESYKASWRAEPRPLCHYRVFGRRPTAQLHRAAWRAGETARRLVRHCRLALGRKPKPGLAPREQATGGQHAEGNS